MSNGSTSFHGIQNVTFGLTDDTGKLISDTLAGLGDDGVVVIDGDGEGATEANVTGLEEAGTVQYANDKVKRVSHGLPQPQVAITMLDMPYEILQKLKGYDSDGKGGWTLRSGTKPHVAMLIHTTGFDGNDYFEGFANGELIEPGHSHGTDNNAEVDANTTLTYQALTPLDNNIFKDSKGKQQPYKMYANYDGSTFDEAAMLKEVFGGFSGTLNLTNVGGDANTSLSENANPSNAGSNPTGTGSTPATGTGSTTQSK
ncbi:phage tail protein [Secundilactobacillus pentosiphilus]|uniref:Phage tail protein n=1 Tax=Secundilactobacillus pentosiphilus TaxID=1714682 RepID=A0A1Z5IUU9_9LACO|nr:phage tail protein [Secundilactobacillus pentosiphilus]GAX05362.1 phage tail protein [Secundilactobacillus pentosiphilus]